MLDSTSFIMICLLAAIHGIFVVLPVAVLGTDAFDVHDIDVATLEPEGAVPLRHKYKDVAAPPVEESMCACSDADPD